jgi:hypothetical protein
MNEQDTQIFRRLLNRLGEFPSESLTVDLPMFIVLLIVSLVTSLAISAAYLKFYENRETGSQIHRAFPLLGPAVTTLFVCIQFSLPLSLGLLGALSIVRFRTPIKEPEEIAFIMVLISASIAIATINLSILVVFLVVSVIALIVQRWAPGPLRDKMRHSFITVTIPHDVYPDGQDAVVDLLSEKLARGRVESVTKTDSTLVLTYLFDAADEANLRAVEASLRTEHPKAGYSVFRGQRGVV